MAEVHHFTYGWFNPVIAYLMAVTGALLGLVCATRARAVWTRGRRRRWLLLAAIALGGAGCWLMHFMATFGFEVPASPVRYDVTLTTASLAIAIVGLGLGLTVAAGESGSPARIPLGGLIAGTGLVAMHYLGMAAIRVTGRLSYQPWSVGASALIGVAAATAALWFAVTVHGWRRLLAAALIIATAVSAMHYVAMAGTRVTLDPDAVDAVGGVAPVLLLVPTTLLAAVTLIGTAFSALQAMTEEEFDGADAGNAGRVCPHGETRSLPAPIRETPVAGTGTRVAATDTAEPVRHGKRAAAAAARVRRIGRNPVCITHAGDLPDVDAAARDHGGRR
jgi:NO-binding membrane sensor protein with MHYT domain